MDETVSDLVSAIMSLALESTAEELAEALHQVVISEPDVCSAFNQAVDRKRLDDELKKRGLRHVPLRRLMTKGEFGVN